MKKEKYTYNYDQIRIWLFKAVLVFSVLSFSGINLQVHSQANLATKTELAESRIRKSTYKLNTQGAILISSTQSDCTTFCIWTILNHYNILRSKFKSFQQRILLYGLTPTDIRIKVPTLFTKDDSPLSLS